MNGAKIGFALASAPAGLEWIAVRVQRSEKFSRLCKKYRVPVAVLDIWMEQMRGLEVQTHLGALSPATKVIVITGSPDPATQRTAMEAGVFGCFHKRDGEAVEGRVYRRPTGGGPVGNNRIASSAGVPSLPLRNSASTSNFNR